MSYSDFKTLDKAINDLNLTLQESHNLFAQVTPIQPSERLKETLAETLELATNISTEKARSELIITPILLEVRRIFQSKIGYFSGISFNVDESRGLNGVCDFILSASENQLLITAPVITVVEAKDNDIKLGLGQCVAEMVAAQIFNERKGLLQTIYGVVSTGTLWKFLTLEAQILTIDRSEYFIARLEEILGILATPFRRS
ncbi:hypothetical protein [Iningainema tapete]|uniref:Uncharacterized protein n=1 Tax=Iningainema tapete BLCC-T55 TaxID=2748662 RepID=A0A8J7C7Z7_9CYAN|nr:hypothetical protein [Iningainema tapete]MBD2773941.1 hypothetical protein [Iningainema tapete BLCC-T55]